MLQAATLQFLRSLHKNNNKQWFEANRSSYEAAKNDFQLLVQALIPAIAAFDEPIGHLAVKDCTFRINRDVRFSKNKNPYKSNMAAYFSSGGKKAAVAGYYFHCEPGNSFVAGGFYSPMPQDLAKLRQEIDYNFDEWKQLLANKKFVRLFPNSVDGEETLVRPPKGYDENNPAIGYLKMKQYIVSTPVADANLLRATLPKDMAAMFATMKPMLDFLNRAVA